MKTIIQPDSAFTVPSGRTVSDKGYLFSLNNSCDTNPIHEELSSYCTVDRVSQSKSASGLSYDELKEFRMFVNLKNT